MEATIFKSTPKQETVYLDLDERLRFIGNDVKTITLKNTHHGSSLILDEIDSLECIIASRPGAEIIFESAPKRPVVIRGEVHDIILKNAGKIHSLYRNSTNSTIDFDNGKSVVVTSSEEVLDEEVDSIILIPKNISDLKISKNYSNILIVGNSKLKSITVHGDGIIGKLSIESSSKLKHLTIEKRVLTCSVNDCKGIETISGFGDRLFISGRRRRNLCIGGFWYRIPDWYSEVVSMLDLTHFNGHLTSEQIKTCDDLGGINITPRTYDGRGGMVGFSEAFNVPIDSILNGINVKRFVNLILEKHDRFFVFAAWCSGNLSRFQQYVAMRVLASLATNGFDTNKILDIRNSLLYMNSTMPNILNESVNSGDLGGKWRPMYSGDSESWENPCHTIMPFGRLDLEIWLNSDAKIEEMLEDKFQFKQMSNSSQYFKPSRSIAFRSLIVTILSASNTSSRDVDAEERLTKLSSALYTNEIINSDPYICEYLIFHINKSRIVNKTLIKELVKGIEKIKCQAWKKVALLIGIIDQTNSSKARVALKRLAADKEFSFDESDLLYRISLEGKDGLESGTFERPKWPYVKNWKKIRRKLFEYNEYI